MTPLKLLSPQGLRFSAAWVTLAALVPIPDLRADVPYSLAPVVFFPPTPPVLGGSIADEAAGRPLLFGGMRLVAPDGVEDFVGDYSYPAVSTRLYSRSLESGLAAKLHDHRSRRLEQLSQLLNEFVHLYDRSDDFNERELRAFADKQTPHLVALENEAEELRLQLIADGWRNGVDWNAGRRWKLDVRKEHSDWIEAESQFQVVRAAAYYQKGLLPQQRGLLCELAMDLQQAARKARGQPVDRNEIDAMFFSPETARLRLPAGASAVLREKLGLFNARKIALKRELHDLLIAQDRESATKRAKAFADLADRQWPAIVALEQLADEMRPELAVALAPKPPPAPPWLPTGLVDFIRKYNEDRGVFLAEFKAAMRAAISEVPGPDASVGEEREQSDYEARKAAALQEANRVFLLENGNRFRALEQRYKTIAETLKVVAEKQKDPKTGRPLTAETLLRQHAESLESFNTFGREATIYTHYRMAMLQPGLSSEQRRMLFAYAVAGLAQPLPYGELLPARQASRPNPVP